MQRPCLAFAFGLLTGAACAPLAGAASAAEATRSVTLVAPLKAGLSEADNPAGLAVSIEPGDTIAVGAKVVFRVTTQKPGYLILIDVDASGKVSQRYPNLYSMRLPAGTGENANRVEAERPALIPNPANPLANFEYVAEAPAGPGLILAMVSPHPVHVVDLPDVPAGLIGSQAAVDYLIEAARQLRIAGGDALEQPQWSFAVRPYAITP